MLRPRERQIEFPSEQTHVRLFEAGMLIGSVVLIVVVVIIVLTVNGPFIGPWG
jgi:hypothetical protein